MKRLLSGFIFLGLLASCSQKNVDDVSYKAGEIAAEVVEVAQEGYEAVVESSQSAYQHLKKGYGGQQKDERRSKSQHVLSDSAGDQGKRSSGPRQTRGGDQFY